MTLPYRISSKLVVNRVFYINVGNIHPEDVGAYMEAVQNALAPEDLKDGVPSLKDTLEPGAWEDLFIPVRTGETRVEFHLLDMENVQIAKHLQVLEREEWFNTLKDSTKAKK